MIPHQGCSYDKVAQKLSALLSSRAMTQSELAQTMGVSPSLISKKMNGAASFTLRDATTLADLFHISVDDLLGREQMGVK